MGHRLKVDLHTHTGEDPKDHLPYSAFDLMDKAAAEGYDALAISNHDILTFNPQLQKYAEARDILLIPGIEITVSRVHILVINPDFKNDSGVHTLDDLPQLKNDKSLVIAPHPFFRLYKSLKSRLYTYVHYFDAIEFTSYYTQVLNFNKKAVRAAALFNKPLVGSSDCHHLWQFGKTFTLIDAPKDIPSIVRAVKEGRVEVRTTPVSFLTLFRMALELLTIEKLRSALSGRR
ncbi:MAG: PHP domain-containing protein [Candidatus Aminicenantales bacterium]